MMNAITIENGSYRARLVSVAYKTSASGNNYIQFLWQLNDGTGRRITSVSFPTKKDGSRNEAGIDCMRKWAVGWDGTDPAWFERELEHLRETDVELVIKNKPWYRDPSQISPQVLFVNPTRTAPSASSASPSQSLRLPTFNAAPNMLDVWNGFCEATVEMNATDRDCLWLSVVTTAVPDKDQDLFTDEDWQKVIDTLKGN